MVGRYTKFWRFFMAIKLNTGKVAFPIEFDNGDSVNIFFNPNDPDLFVRFSEFEKRMSEKIKDIDDIDMNEDGTPKDINIVDEFKKMKDALCEELDIAFGNKISGDVFKHCSPFAIINGDYFVIQFIMAIRPEIEKHNKKANADVQKKMAKHINKYAKK